MSVVVVLLWLWHMDMECFGSGVDARGGVSNDTITLTRKVSMDSQHFEIT